MPRAFPARLETRGYKGGCAMAEKEKKQVLSG
jgi:hypothetical protein